jgi:hypothetical protein
MLCSPSKVSFHLHYPKKKIIKRYVWGYMKIFHELTFLIKQIIFINVEYIYIKKLVLIVMNIFLVIKFLALLEYVQVHFHT